MIIFLRINSEQWKCGIRIVSLKCCQLPSCLSDTFDCKQSVPHTSGSAPHSALLAPAYGDFLGKARPHGQT